MPLLIIQDQTLNHIIDAVVDKGKYIVGSAVIGAGIIAGLAYGGLMPGIGNNDHVDKKKPAAVGSGVLSPIDRLNPRFGTYTDCKGGNYTGQETYFCLTDKSGNHAYNPVFENGDIDHFEEVDFSFTKTQEPAFQK